ncbi:DUF427 domain-containing protein [Anabaenopsis tanganyikae CS-531]|uniref:DUF427 domain-containing protein n=2 Tax=Anabaenopsis TaxID=110103 RepID=A0ABT5AUK4_9CYAN|nr:MULTISPECIES: DUF427 domain-containing protein [Anabaenopsis]MDB9541008.1 DUF427 domain-containing protein [Anabaenopsis arnoldii]MDH6093446.1 DUF427 domain-containing protein [Anabaenopsis arnoldii]MDH6105117.1 DUF427 domain-containing protein [Anabaenopsis tanganyikae CS-531]
MRPQPTPPKPGQESVWDYPRPAVLQDTDKHLKVICGGIILADTRRGKRVLETSHPPTYYFPPEDIKLEHLIETPKKNLCEWKGAYQYYDISIGNQYIHYAAWRYFDPTPNFLPIREYYGFIAALMDACYVNDELVVPQSGDFYGGWITADIVGPFKGGAGTWGW